MDHRGIPSYVSNFKNNSITFYKFQVLNSKCLIILQKPGRVVTLLESKNLKDEVWGCAYQIATENIEAVCSHLDHRERGGYIRKNVLFYPQDKLKSNLEPFHLAIYIALEDNSNFAGTEDINTIANCIANAVGTSGHNTEYLYNLAAAMRNIAPEVIDDHLFELEETVKHLETLNLKVKDKKLIN